MNLIAIESSEQENLSYKRIVGVHMSGSHYSGIIIFEFEEFDPLFIDYIPKAVADHEIIEINESNLTGYD
uniref:Uncharacterized protein n=1 Tax=Acrobeloides nanus TaxID=290746 RepID=A0A914CPP9_9BILA